MFHWTCYLINCYFQLIASEFLKYFDENDWENGWKITGKELSKQNNSITIRNENKVRKKMYR